MSDTFGAMTIPIAAPAAGESVSDTCLDVLLAYLKATLNAYATTAWQAVAPNLPVVKNVVPNNPEDFGFDEKDLPALYGWRAGQAQPPGWTAEDWLTTEDAITVLWVSPPVPQARKAVRGQIANGIAKAVLVALARERDPSYAHAADPDTKAATSAAAADAIKLSTASPTSSASWSGAALDGAIGTGTIDPPRPVTVTLGGDAAAFTVGSTIAITGTNVVGVAQTRTLTVAGLGTLTTGYDFASVTSIAVDAQASGAGTISVGLGAYAGKGSLVRTFAGAFQWFVAKWSTRPVRIQMVDGGPVRLYDAVELQITVREKLDVDTSDTSRFQPNTATDVAFVRDDDSVIESASWPDNA